MSIFSAPSFYSQADQDIYNRGFSFIPQEQFRSGAFNIPTDDDNTGGVTTLPVNSFTGGGGGGGAAFTGTTGDLTTNFIDTITNRQNRLNNPSDKFFGFNTMRDQQLTGADAGEYIGSGTAIPQERTFAGNIQNFLTPQSADDIIAGGYEPKMKLGIIANLLPDRYGELPRGDQAFIARNMGYTGPTVFGENTSGLSKDPFGLNTRSAFGNYAERVGKEYASLGDSLSGRLADKYGAEFDEETGMFVGANAAKANQMTKMMRAKYNFYGQQTRQRDLDRKAAAEAAAAAAERQIALDRARADRRQYADVEAAISRGERVDDRDRPSEGPTAVGAGMGVGGGYASDYGFLKDGGRVSYMNGGLTDLVDIYD